MWPFKAGSLASEIRASVKHTTKKVRFEDLTNVVSCHSVNSLPTNYWLPYLFQDPTQS